MSGYSIIFNILAILVGLGSIIANILIAHRTIRTNKEIAKENAGKNRVVYSTEQKDVGANDRALKEELNQMLNSGNYTILSAFVNLGNTTQTRFVLGKINS